MSRSPVRLQESAAVSIYIYIEREREREGSRLPPRENNDGVHAPHQCSRVDSRLLRGISTDLQDKRVQTRLCSQTARRSPLVWHSGTPTTALRCHQSYPTPGVAVRCTCSVVQCSKVPCASRCVCADVSIQPTVTPRGELQEELASTTVCRYIA